GGFSSVIWGRLLPPPTGNFYLARQPREPRGNPFQLTENIAFRRNILNSATNLRKSTAQSSDHPGPGERRSNRRGRALGNLLLRLCHSSRQRPRFRSRVIPAARGTHPKNESRLVRSK